MTTTDLTPLAREAGEHVTDETWTQHAMDGPGGTHCAHAKRGALATIARDHEEQSR